MKQPSFLRVLAAYCVHLLTASGAFVGFLSILFYFQEDYRMGTLFIILAVFIDAIDGFFARMCRVKEVLPHFDGSLMDNIIDFQTYTVAPLVMLWRTGMVEDSWFLIVAGLVLIASLYQFCQGSAKTEDHFFLGFPSYWNIVIIYLYWTSSSSLVNIAILLFFVVLSFVPIKFLYPTRTRYFPITSMIVSSLGGLAFLYISLFSWENPPPPYSHGHCQSFYVLCDLELNSQ